MLLSVSRIQQVSIATTEMSLEHRSNLHIIVIALLSLVGRVTGISSIIDYCEKVIESRKEEAAFLLPPLLSDPQKNINLDVPHLMLDKVRMCFFSLNFNFIKNQCLNLQMALTESLQSAGIDHMRLQTATPYSLIQCDSGHRPSWVDTGNSHGSVDLGNNDIDSISSSPGVQRVNFDFTHHFLKFLLFF